MKYFFIDNYCCLYKLLNARFIFFNTLKKQKYIFEQLGCKSYYYGLTKKTRPKYKMILDFNISNGGGKRAMNGRELLIVR